MKAIVTHTPGPWEIDERYGMFFITKEVPPAIGRPIPVGIAYAEGDARLFLAAPDVLAALKALIPEIEDEIVQRQVSGNDEEWRGLSALSDAARLAVAKAENPS